MPLKVTATRRRPNRDMEFIFDSKSLAELTGVGHMDGVEYRVRLSRNFIERTGETYGILEIQQKDHQYSQVEEVELYGDGYTYACVPLPKTLKSLDGDVVALGSGAAELQSRLVAPWVYPDSDGNYQQGPTYSLQALQSKLTVEQTDELFAVMGVASWEDVMEAQSRL